MQIWSLGQEDPLENGMATHSSIFAWRIPMDREAWCVTVCRVQKSQTWLKQLSTHVFTIARAWKQPESPLIEEWIKNVVYLYNGILLTHKKNEIMPFTAAWIYLEIVILSEVRQTVRQISNYIAFCCCLLAKLCLTLLQPHGLQTSRILCPWDFQGKNTGVGCHFFLWGSSWPRDQTHVSCISSFGRWILYHWAIC